ncbi:TetR/AcrR family transcriptional regulator [Paratissierella segnis]|jgi:AcrR family transcriptional regulator|uniref:TetR/AcrR family transcriptional regulator n=1 Tax=Paratissierella segnis TaxID=2763679 RepID=A0A926ETI7_9FIRM|nr:TetR/AcrR family transcriptional regulator [Paratissierella segnis]MBC8587963.1 TetR/AcrR family transcriptional regulator [Paratissierella segnis]
MIQKNHATKKKILGVTKKMAVEKGFESLTIRDICKEAKISVGAFYHHFPSKEELINESFLIYDHDLDSRIDQYDISTPLLSLKNLLLDQVQFVSGFPYKLVVEYYRAILASSSKGAVSKERTYYKAVDHFVELSLIKNQLSSNYSKDYLTNYFIKHIRGNLIHWCLNPDTMDIVNQTSSELDQLFEMFSQ